MEIRKIIDILDLDIDEKERKILLKILESIGESIPEDAYSPDLIPMALSIYTGAWIAAMADKHMPTRIAYSLTCHDIILNIVSQFAFIDVSLSNDSEVKGNA